MTSACCSQEFLAREVERTSYSYSLAWEGEEEDVRDKGDAVIRVLPTRPYGAGAIVQWINLDPVQADERLEALEQEAGTGGRPVRWTFGDTSSPPNLAQRLEARGLRRIIHWPRASLRIKSAARKESPRHVAFCGTMTARFSRSWDALMGRSRALPSCESSPTASLTCATRPPCRHFATGASI